MTIKTETNAEVLENFPSASGLITKRLYVPKNEKVTEKIEGDADSIVAKLMDILKNKLKVI